ncbi:MAG TPA: hypothetical protein VFE25_06900 [Opitutaceae bacterium]|jgi:hypothetical protein|nr:hypothetical protein [Opitutaceae bacterium]
MDRGELSAAELTVLLDAFVDIDPADNEEHDPNIVVVGRGAKLIIRTSRGRLQVYDVRDHAAPALEMSVSAILQRLDKTVETTSPFAVEEPMPAPSAPHRGIAFAMLIVGLCLNGYILYSVFYVESVNKKVEVKLLSDATEMKIKEQALSGVYATGSRTGDRVIEVDAYGQIRFYEIGAKGPINDSKDTYRVGRHDGTMCLTTDDSGVVDLVGETLVYYRDVYQRRKQASP